LDLGASEPRAGFLTADLHLTADLTFDFTRKFPLPDQTFEFVYCSHVLEHFFYDQLVFLLKEVARILKPGGEFSICVPNARPFIEAYCSNDEFDTDSWCTYKPAFNYHSKLDIINYMAYMGGVHRMMFDEQNLKAILESQGFKRVELRAFKPGLDIPERQAESLYLACYK
jgi:predicted SAM-dependent methyltransferase